MSGFVWKHLGRVLGTLAGALEVSWGRLGRSLWCLGSSRGTKTGQTGPRWLQGVQRWIQIGRASAASERASEAQEMQRRDNGVARATGATRDSGTTEDAQGFLRMFPGVVKIALERMFHTCCRDFFIATRFPFIYKDKFFFETRYKCF